MFQGQRGKIIKWPKRAGNVAIVIYYLPNVGPIVGIVWILGGIFMSNLKIGRTHYCLSFFKAVLKTVVINWPSKSCTRKWVEFQILTNRKIDTIT